MRWDESSGALVVGCGGMDGDWDAGGERVAGAAGAGEGVAWAGGDCRGLGGLCCCAGYGFAGAAATCGCDGTGAVLRRDVLRGGWGGGGSGIFDSRWQPSGAGVGAGEQRRAWTGAEREADAGIFVGCAGAAVGGVGGSERGSVDGASGSGGFGGGGAGVKGGGGR